LQEFSFETPLNEPAWKSTVSPGALVVAGPHDGTILDLNANQHAGLGPGEVDFYPENVSLELNNVGGYRLDPAAPSAVPEPSALMMVASFCGTCGLIWSFRLKRPAVAGARFARRERRRFDLSQTAS